MNRPLLYVAAPYTRPDPVENTHRVIRVADEIYARTEWVPVVPHLTLLWHMVVPHDVDFWYEYDHHLLRVCQAIVQLPGASSGADAECDLATNMGIEFVPFAHLPQAARDEWYL